jgi:demethylmenaquinone methyltransferase/2-methoxy-6-polyprenyl-1,4-benzoquinol methylase
MERGLKDRWEEVLKSLKEIIPFYDKMNKIMSFGKDLVLREVGLRETLMRDDLVLDLGCGPGVMSQIAIKNGLAKHIVLVDALPQMLAEAKKRLKDLDLEFLLSVFENLPFKEDSFDAVVCGFSIRDALDMNKGFNEILRTLKPKSGRLLIVDLGKPDNLLLKLAIGLYWKLIVPLIALIVLGSKGLPYLFLYETYKRLPSNKELEGYLKERFRNVKFIKKMLGGAIIIIARDKI